MRSIILGNGNSLVCLDSYGRVRDFYYPYVGQENHVSGNIFRTGVFVDGSLSWLHDSPWEIHLDYKKETLVSDVKAYNRFAKLSLHISEAVHHDKNIFLREITVHNALEQLRTVKLFFNQKFSISEANVGETVYYDPRTNSIVDYRGQRYFMISGLYEGNSFDDYATGLSGEHSKEGTFIDAVDGALSRNPIEHGAVDSTIGFTLEVPAGGSATMYYWVCVGNSYEEVNSLNSFIKDNGPETFLPKISNYWRKWVNNKNFDFCGLDDHIIRLFKRSLLIVKAQTDARGALIAANDSDTLYSKKDTYSYMWPRDGALIARSLDRVGHRHTTQKFFDFCSKLVTSGGYLLHKYRPDGSLGSSWHPWVKRNNVQLPIQEDESALLLDALWKRYLRYRDTSYAKKIYKTLIKKIADFLVSYRDPITHLPKESYDLWEEKLGVHTFTSSTVYAGLRAAKNFADVLGYKKDAIIYSRAADEVRAAVIEHLYDVDDGVFVKSIYFDEKNEIKKDKTIDMSTGYALFEYGILDANDPKVVRTMAQLMTELLCNTPIGGFARYKGDHYFSVDKNVPGNPWFISTLWVAEYFILRSKKPEDLKNVEQLLKWVTQRALSTGALPEQVHPNTGDALSVCPLTWSHAAFVIAVVKYLDKLEDFKLCDPYLHHPIKRIKEMPSPVKVARGLFGGKNESY